MSSYTESKLQDLVEMVAKLRSESGCPWDRTQTLESMRPYLLEEVYEVLEAMEPGAGEEGLQGELGDLLFVVFLIARIAEEQGLLTLSNTVQDIHQKMVDRHPHVFGDGADDPDPGGIAAWEARKQQDGRSRLAGVPRTLPALLRAHRQGEKAAAVGFDWPDASGVLDKIREELGELIEAMASGDSSAIAHEYGDLLLSTATLGRHLNLPPEATLRTANDRFANRFERLESLAKAEGVPLNTNTDPDVLDALWERAKRGEGAC